MNPAMTPIESIYEIRSAVIDLRKYLNSKDGVVSKRAHMKYAEWVNRFFMEQKCFVAQGKRLSCLDDPDYFLKLLDEAAACYYESNDFPIDRS